MGFLDFFKDPSIKLKPLSFEKSKEKCVEIDATKKEINDGKKGVKYICEDCGYHQDKSWDGKLRRCNACGGWLRYWQLYERILYHRNS